jgi:hypothetical protein
MLNIPKLREEFNKLKATMTPEKVAEWVKSYGDRFQLLLCEQEKGCVFNPHVLSPDFSNPVNFMFVPLHQRTYYIDMLEGTWYTPVVVTDEDLKEGDYFVDMHQLRLDRVFKVTGNQAYIDFLNRRRIANNEFVGDTSTRRQLCKVESIANTYFDVNQLAVEDIVWFLEERVKDIAK